MSAPGIPPRPGAIYVWELDSPSACELIRVKGTFWNGEEWMVRTELLHETLSNSRCRKNSPEHLNDLRRFREAVTLVREP